MIVALLSDLLPMFSCDFTAGIFSYSPVCSNRKMKNWPLFTAGLYSKGLFQRLAIQIHISLKRIGFPAYSVIV